MERKKLKRTKKIKSQKPLPEIIQETNDLQIVNEDEEILEEVKEIDLSEEAVGERLSRLEEFDEE